MKPPLHGLPLAVAPIAIALTIALSGCDVGYKVDTSRNTVTWATWNEGYGRCEWPVVGADAKTFRVMPIRSNTGRQEFGRDKAHVYRESRRIEGADPDSFREFGPRLYRDDKSVFRLTYLKGTGRDAETPGRPSASPYTIVQLPESDPDSFRQLDPTWSRDAKRVFFETRGFVPSDIDSFEILAGGWARDRVAVYYASKKVTRAHRESFEVLDTWHDFGRDSDHVFWKGWLVDIADPKTFVGVRPNKGHDHKTSFYCILKDEENYGPQYRDNEKLEVLTKPVEQATKEEQP
jgi:hypothetical protein